MKIYSKGGKVLAELSDYPYSGVFMGERFVSSSFKTDSPIDFLPGDYLTFRGESFVLDDTPTPKKISSTGSTGDAFQYDLKFISIGDKELRGCLFRNIFLNDNRLHPASPIIDVYADAKLLANMIQASLNEEYKGENQWTITVLKDTEAKQITVQDILCWDAVALFNSEYNLNFTIKGRNVTVGTVGKLVDHIFKHGGGNGLTEITPISQNSNKIITKLSAFGGNRNLPKDYNTYAESPTLMLPGYKTTGEDFITSEQGVANYGNKPDVFRDEDIYPSIHNVTGNDLRAAGIQTEAVGRVDEIVYMEPVSNPSQATFNVWIKDIGFDVNNYKTGVPMIVSMRDGWVGGNEYELVKCIVDTSKSVEVDGKTWVSKYKLTLNKNDNSNIILPDDKTYIRTGDHFVLLEIYMPDVYVKAAEQRLLKRAKEYLAKYDHVKATYSINMDKVFMAYHPSIGDTIYEGDLIRVVDEDLKLDREIIIQNLNIKTGGAVYEYDVTLSDDPVATTLDRVQDNISEIEQNVTANKIDGVKEARRRAIELQLLKANIFDPDGEIKDTFLQTMMLQVGANSMNYQMDKTTARPNLVNMSFTNTSISLGADNLVHFAYGAGEEKASTWHIATPFSGSGLIAEKTYFVAIKASRDNLTAEWIVDENTFGSESVPGYYIFNFGILSEVIDGARLFSETRGNIYGYGDELVAGLIASINRYSYFNLNTGDFQIYNTNTGQGLQFKDGILTLGSFNSETGKFSSSITKIENDIIDTSQQAADAQSKANEADRKAQEAQEYITGTILPDLETLQAQVDGQVNSWFYAYSPTLVNYPASSWDTVLKKDAAIGDTFTNTQEFIDNSTTPDAGKSWRWIKEGNIYKWTPIADSDAVKALAKAAKAEATADGKSTIYLLKPSTYDIGDAWVLESDTIKPPYKKGEMLNAVKKNTVFTDSDWEKRDLSADNAISNIKIGGSNLFPITKLKKISYQGASRVEGIGANTIFKCNNPLQWAIVPLSLPIPLFAENTDFIISFDLRNTNEFGFEVTGPVGNPTLIPRINFINKTNEWKRFNQKYNSGNISNISGINLWGVGDITHIKIEIGNKETDWSQAQEDIDTQVESKPTTFIQPAMPGSARKNDTWYSGETQSASLYTYACVSTYTSEGTMANWLLVADNTNTTIENGLITTGTIYLRGGSTIDKLQVKAGITGSGESDNSVRFWAGGTLAEANALVNNNLFETKATFAITQGGKLFATNADITGKIIATSGEFTGRIRSSASGNRLEINPENGGELAIFNKNGQKRVELGFGSVDVGRILCSSSAGYAWLDGDRLIMSNNVLGASIANISFDYGVSFNTTGRVFEIIGLPSQSGAGGSNRAWRVLYYDINSGTLARSNT